MDESIVQQPSNTSVSVTGESQKKGVSTSQNFWHTFRLFPLRSDEFLFDYFYLLILGMCAVYLILGVLYDARLGAISSHQDFYNLKRDLSNWILISLAVASVLMMLAFNYWRRQIPIIFQALLNKGRIHSLLQDGDVKQEYERFLEAYQNLLWSNKRYILIGATVTLSMAIFSIPEISYIAPPSASDALLSILRWLIVILSSLLGGLVIGYFSGVAIWAIGATGLYIRNLSSKFSLTIQASHPDSCGGLKSLGNFCFQMALPTVVMIAFSGVYSIGSVIYPTLINGQRIIQVAAIVALLVFALPVAAIAFFAPLWDIHRKMVAEKETFEDEFANRIANLEKRIQTLLDQKALEEAKAAKEEMEVQKVLYPSKTDYPTWPFDGRILAVFLAPQIFSIISLILTLIKPF